MTVNKASDFGVRDKATILGKAVPYIYNCIQTIDIGALAKPITSTLDIDNNIN